MAAAAAPLPKLTVIKATYGQGANADVSSQVSALIAKSGGNLSILASADFNQMFGDTQPGVAKLFHLVYAYGPNGAHKSMTHGEKHPDIHLPALEIRAGQVLTVNVIKAIGLRDTRTLGKQNPYAKLTTGAESFKTKAHEKGGTNPVWNQSFIFNIDGKDQFMHVVVYDKETISDDTIARFDIPLPTLAAATGEVAYNLVHPNDFKKSAGSIVLSCEFRDPNAPVIPTAAAAPAAAAATAPAQPAQPQVVYMQQPQVMYMQPAAAVMYAPPQPMFQIPQPQIVYQQPQVVYQQPQVVYQAMAGAVPAAAAAAAAARTVVRVRQQSGWRWCGVCQALFFSSVQGNGICAAGGSHDPSGSAEYLANQERDEPSSQEAWRWCYKCSCMCYPALSTSNVCCTGGQHTAGGDPYFMMRANQDGEQGFKWCSRCGVLAFASKAGRCAATNGTHDFNGSGAYVVSRRS